MAAKNPKAYFPGRIAKISFKPVDAWARRSAKHSPYFDTWLAAHQHMIQKELQELERAEKSLVYHRKRLAAVLAMQNPDSPQEASDA